MKVQVEIEVVTLLERPEGLSDDDWEWLATLRAMKVAAGYMYLAVFQNKDEWRIYGYLHKSGLSPYYATRSSEREAYSLVELGFPGAVHAHNQVFTAAPTFRALYRWGESRTDPVAEKQGHEC